MSLHNMTPICIPCVKNYTCHRNGVKVRLGDDAISDSDVYCCPSCGHQIVIGFAQRPAERYAADTADVFRDWDEALGESIIAAPHKQEVYA